MKSSSAVPRKIKGRSLRLFLYGPGVGESIVVRLPCGNWGVVDCCQPSLTTDGTLAFLKRKAVDSLAFFCHTHPHEDHFLGADLLLSHFTGKIDRIWRHPGFSNRDITTRAVLAAKIQAEKNGDAEPEAAATSYCKLLACIDREKNEIRKRHANVFAENYRRITGPVEVMAGDDYRVRALAPSADALEEAEAHLADLRADLGFSAFADDSGAFLNNLSVVIHISFGQSDILLLGDAQGCSQDPHHALRRLTVLKIAHHGSENGMAATLVAKTRPSHYKISQGILSPYTRSGLPAGEMLTSYRRACKAFACPQDTTASPLGITVPGLPGAMPVHRPGCWIGLEVFADGKVKPCNAADP